jgi:hypothetical protein
MKCSDLSATLDKTERELQLGRSPWRRMVQQQLCQSQLQSVHLWHACLGQAQQLRMKLR